MESVQARMILSANEAASVTGVPLKEVHRIVDAGLLEGAVENCAGDAGHCRPWPRRPEAGACNRRPLDAQRAPPACQAALKQPASTGVGENPLTVDVRPMEAAIRRGLDALDKARRMVSVDKEVLGGIPCFKGTRIPVHDIAAMIVNGDRKSAVLRAYPRLTAGQIDLAVLYAGAYPRRGRPRRRPPWRKTEPISSDTRSLDDLLRTS